MAKKTSKTAATVNKAPENTADVAAVAADTTTTTATTDTTDATATATAPNDNETVTVAAAFYDMQENTNRSIGDEYATTPKRAAELRKLKFIK